MRFAATFAVVLIAFAIAGCSSSKDREIKRIMDSPISYQSHLSPWANMDDYMTWNWVPIPENIPIDPRARDPKVRAEIEKNVEKQMKVRGFLRTQSVPDLYINYHVARQNIDEDFIKKMYDGTYLPAYRMEFQGPASARREWKEGSVLVFLFDSKEERMVWQSSATAEVTDGAPEQRSLERLDDAMKVMFTSLPGKPAWQTQQ
jgi:hypothetical protein